jgi:hypothetical protein
LFSNTALVCREQTTVALFDERICELALWMMLKRQFLEMLASEQTKDELLWWREGCSADLGVYWLDLIDHKLLAMPDHGTAACCHYVLVLINIMPIREFDYKAIFDGSHNDRRLIPFTAAPPDVSNNGEWSERGACQPAGQRIQGVLENGQQAMTESLLKSHRLSPTSNFSEIAVTRRSALQTNACSCT